MRSQAYSASGILLRLRGATLRLRIGPAAIADYYTARGITATLFNCDTENKLRGSDNCDVLGQLPRVAALSRARLH